MKAADKKGEFYLGVPDICKPADIPLNYNAYKGCELFDKHKNIDIPNKTSLLIMKNGGMSLSQFGTKINKNELPISTKDMELFWLEAYRMLYGVKLMLEHDLLHRDIKSSNLVYDISTNKMHLIDFGEMGSLSGLIDEAIADNYGHYWSYFPWETEFIIKHRYDRLVKRLDGKLENVEKELDRTFKPLDEQHKIFFDVFIYYLETIKDLIETWYIPCYRELLIDIATSEDPNLYETMVHKCFHTFDLFGLGTAYAYVFFRTMPYLPDDERVDLLFIILKIINPNVFTRSTVDMAIDDFRQFFNRYGWLERHKDYVQENRQYFEHESAFDEIKLEKSDYKLDMSKAEKEELINMDPPVAVPVSMAKSRRRTGTPAPSKRASRSRKTRRCPRGFHRNPRTGECEPVNVISRRRSRCPNGTRRNRRTGECEPKK